MVCSETDYSEPSSVKRNNQAVDRMYEIVNSLVGDDSILEFSKLLDESNYNVNEWAAIHMLEKLDLDRKIERKALRIIKSVAKGNSAKAMGFESWLKRFGSPNRYLRDKSAIIHFQTGNDGMGNFLAA